MATNNKRIATSELDFSAIKTSFKDYLRGQSQFTDFDFEGSNMSVLLDVLAYNTHYRALYDNFTFNEMFLDSASKRDNVVSRAREIGYTPTSIRAATAEVSLTLTNAQGGPSVLVLPKLTPFSASLNGGEVSFVTLETYSAASVNGIYTFPSIRLIQGSFVTDRFNYTQGSRVIITNPGADLSTLTVKVQANTQSGLYTTYRLAETLVGIGSVDNVYWIKEVSSGLYELEFGNGVIGTKLADGNNVHIEYIVTEGLVANGAKMFKYSGPQLYNGTVALATIAQASGGAALEDVDTIKFNAPKMFTAQNRAVTVEDYRNLVYNLVPEAASVNVWSGADNNPPEYGKVFICIKPKTVERFTNSQKVAIKADVVKSKNVVSVIPEIVDPLYIRVAVNATIYYDQKVTTKSPNDLKLLVQNVISNYNINDLQKFEGILRYSKLTRLIDDADPSIVSNVTSLKIIREVYPKYNTMSSYVINLVNPIYNSLSEISVYTSGFYILGSDLIHYIEDDGAGNLRLFYYANLTKQIVNAKIGTVNYSKGIIEVTGVFITSIIGAELNFTITPSSYDIVSVLDQLVEIPLNFITVNAISDQSLSSSGGGANYVFTTSRS